MKALVSLDTKLHDLEVDKAIFYHLPKIGQKGDRKRYVTVCLLLKEKKACARGISICSPKDAMNPHLGKNIALGRAIKAMTHRKRNRIPSHIGLPAWRDEDHIDRLYDSDMFADDLREVQMGDYIEELILKACYMPKLTKHEEYILRRMNEKKPKKDMAV